MTIGHSVVSLNLIEPLVACRDPWKAGFQKPMLTASGSITCIMRFTTRYHKAKTWRAGGGACKILMLDYSRPRNMSYDVYYVQAIS